MGWWSQPADPIGRSLSQLERQIAAVEKQIRDLSQQADRPPPANSEAKPSGTRAGGAGEHWAGFVRQMLAPPRRQVPVSYRANGDLFDLAGPEALRNIEASPAACPPHPELDLFSSPGSGESKTWRRLGAAPAKESTGPGSLRLADTSRLAQYLGAGSIRTYRPLKHVEREARNRFFSWVGLSLIACWLIYVVVR